MTTRDHLPRPRTTKFFRALVLATLPIVGLLGLSAWARAGDEHSAAKEQPIRAKITDLDWLEGHWTTSFDGNELHEIWSPPVRDCMMASFCWIKKGNVWMYELFSIAEENDGLVLRFKHFSRELHGWEEKDEALTLVLVGLEENVATFENSVGGSPGRIVFRKESPTRLTVQVGGVKADGGFEVKYEKEK